MITAIWILAFLLVAWAALAWLPEGLSGHMPLPYMIALIPFLWIPLLMVGVWAGAFRQWAACVLCLAWALASLNSFAQYNRTRLPAFLAGSPQRNGREGGKPYADANAGTGADTGTDCDNDADVGTNAEAANNAAGSASADNDRTSHAAAFHVMTLNCRYGRASAEAIVNAVRDRSIDVLALQECTDELMDALDAAGLAALMPYRQLGEPKDTDNGGFNALFTRLEPVGFQRQAVVIPAADVPAITLEIPAAEAPAAATAATAATATDMAASEEHRITFASAHPKSPMRGCAQWAAGIVGLSELARTSAQGDHDIAVVMGDLNSQLEHATFRRLLAAGFTDASLSEGKGRNTTFPRWLPWPRIELDHILTTAGAQPSEVASFPVEGTDHLALTATLTV